MSYTVMWATCGNMSIRENIALRQSLTNPYNICIFKNIHNSGKSTGTKYCLLFPSLLTLGGKPPIHGAPQSVLTQFD